MVPRIVVLLLLSVVSCKTMETAAAKDPVKCERNPQCQRRSERASDCATQCSDDAECMKRCETVQSGLDRMP